MTNFLYTLDGTTPTATSTLYSSPITIDETTTLKAIAIKTGLTNSEILTEIYTILPAVVPVTGVSLSANIPLVQGDSITLTPIITPPNATNKNVSWDSETTAVATINADGTVTAIATGTTKITVTTADGGFTAECTITVKPVPASIAVTKQPDKTIYRTGEPLDITGIEVTATYSDNSTEIVLITAAHITGFDSLTSGDKNLTVTYGGKTTTFTITVMVTVTFDANGGTPAPTSPVTIMPGSTITQPPTMTKAWHTFGGWYMDSTYTTPAIFPITVNSNVNLYARWIVNTLTSVANVSSYLASLPANTVANPADLPVNINLGTMTAVDSNWGQLLDAINTADRYVNLDFASCTMTGTSFNPDYNVAPGKDKIVSIILPTVATSIAAGTSYSDPTFKNFSNLKSVSGAYVTTINSYAFRGCYGLQNINFPQVTSIGNYAFYICTSLQNVNFPEVTSIGSAAFEGCTSLQSVNIPKVTNIDSQAFIYTGTTTLSITMGSVAPTLGYEMFYDITAAKTVTVKIPTGATGYSPASSPFSGSTVTVSGTNTAANWANGFRGGGWDGSTWATGGGTSYIYQNITVIIQGQ